MNWLIRVARPEDAEAIVGILNPIIEAGCYTILDQPYTAASEREYIANFPARGIFLVAVDERDGKIVGFQSMEPFSAGTRAFDHVGVVGTFVDLSRRRQGIGKALFEATFRAAREKGYEKILTYIRADNPAALASYQQQGFRIVGTAKRQAKVNEVYIDEMIIEKLL